MNVGAGEWVCHQKSGYKLAQWRWPALRLDVPRVEDGELGIAVKWQGAIAEQVKEAALGRGQGGMSFVTSGCCT